MDDMKAADGGSIINLGSISWMLKNGGYPVYVMSKSAVQGLTRGLARDLGHFNIRVNTLVPGWVMTEKQKRLWLDDAGRRSIKEGQCIDAELHAGRSRPHGAVPRRRRQPDDHRAGRHRRRRLGVSDSRACARAAALLVDTKCTLGEGATWCARTGRFYWTDIEGARLWRYDPRDGRSTFWRMPERLATFALCADPHYLLLGLASHLAFFDLATGETQRIVDVEPGLNTRVNDGRCDRQGRFVFGTKDEGSPLTRSRRVLSSEPRSVAGALAVAGAARFRTASRSVRTARRCTTAIRRPAKFARATTARTAASPTTACSRRLTDATGEPDGSTVDRDGGLWNAQWGGARVVRYGPDGVETERVDGADRAAELRRVRRRRSSARCTSRARASISTRPRSRATRVRAACSSPTRGARFAEAGVPGRAGL